MSKDGEIVGVIPVKGTSERITLKNLRKFHDTSIFELKLDQLQLVENLDRIVVSSEDDKVLDIAINKGFEVHRRDPKYSTSDVPMSDVYSYIASEIEGEHIAWINVTNPLAGSEIYTRAIQSYRDLGAQYDCLLSVSNVQDYLFQNGSPINFKPNPWPKSQDLSDVCEMTFVINILKRKDMVDWGSCVGNSPYLHYINKIDSWDIDFQEDFDFCEMIYRNRQLKASI